MRSNVYITLRLTNNFIDSGQARAKNVFSNVVWLCFMQIGFNPWLGVTRNRGMAERRNNPSPPSLSLSHFLISHYLFLIIYFSLSISLSIFLPWSNAACTLYFMLFVTYFWEVILGKFNFSVQFFLPRFRIWGPYSTVPWFRAIFRHSVI